MRLTLAEYLSHEARLKAPKTTPTGEGVEREADLHEQITRECRHRGWVIVHSRMDRRTTTAVGVTDFVIAADGGRTFWIEAKTRTGKLTREQQATIHWLQSLGHAASVVRSLEDFLNVTAMNNGGEQRGPSSMNAGFLKRPNMKTVNGIPRRIRTDLYTKAEKAISAAVDAVEMAGADKLLTDALILLGEAKSKVADYVETQELWQCPICGNVMTEDQSKGYRSCPTGVHGGAHVRIKCDAPVP